MFSYNVNVKAAIYIVHNIFCQSVESKDRHPSKKNDLLTTKSKVVVLLWNLPRPSYNTTHPTLVHQRNYDQNIPLKHVCNDLQTMS
jgi:hypothetical protein